MISLIIEGFAHFLQTAGACISDSFLNTMMIIACVEGIIELFALCFFLSGGFGIFDREKAQKAQNSTHSGAQSVLKVQGIKVIEFPFASTEGDFAPNCGGHCSGSVCMAADGYTPRHAISENPFVEGTTRWYAWEEQHNDS